MNVMLLAAGLGKRLRPITNTIPKPLVQVAGKALIEHHLENIKAAGFNNVVINVSYLGELIKNHLDDGSRFGLSIQYSEEGPEPLETAGGIINALPLLGQEPFLVVNADIWCEHSLSMANISSEKLAHLVLVDNPEHNRDGDFAYEFGKVYNDGQHRLTFSGIGIYRPELFKNIKDKKISLAPILRTAVDQELVSAEYYTGKWFDIGTKERLEETDEYVSKHQKRP